ncbi:MAG: SpoIVB peptidase S55 domain-containing protein [Oscillospiraceae bacterium]
MTPVERDGQRRLGIYVREGIAGVGTVTYYDPGERHNTGGLGAWSQQDPSREFAPH